jgi:predicted aldo/keto reductase-like oxidoreductase
MYHGKKKYMGAMVPPEIRQALEERIEQCGLDYTDNYRFSPMDDPEGLDEFEAIKESGCCGSYEREVEDSTGRKWLIGCNYGH